MTNARTKGAVVLGAVVLAVVLFIGACGGRERRNITGLTPLDTNTTTTVGTVASPPTTSPATTSPVERAPSSPWTSVAADLAGMESECGNLALVSARPDRDMITASVAQKGLWTSEDGADTWSPLGQGSGSATITNRGSTIVYDPENPDTFWESGIYNGGGIYRTDDNGVTFRQLGDAVHSEAVSVDFTDPDRKTLLSGTHERGALLRSTDGGATWTDISSALPDDIGFAHGPHVVDAQTHLLGTGVSDNAGVFRTTDGGVTWTKVFEGAVAGQPLAASDGSLYWVLESTGGIIRSTDDGLTWTMAARDGTVLPSAWGLLELPNGDLAAIGSSSLVLSDDQGESWRAIGASLPYRPTGFTYSPVRKAFYIWRFTCEPEGANPVVDDAIMEMNFDSSAA